MRTTRDCCLCFARRLKIMLALSNLVPNAAQLLRWLRQTRKEALKENTRHGESGTTIVDAEILHLQVALVEALLRRRSLWSMSPGDLTQLVVFCGHPEFRGHPVLTSVLGEVLGRQRNFLSAYKTCAAILATRHSVRHYLSTSNRDRVMVGRIRLPDFLLDWMVKLLRVQVDLLGIVDREILRELLDRGAGTGKVDQLRNTEHFRLWEMDGEEGISPCPLADLVYLCLAFFYYLEFRRRVGCATDSSIATATNEEVVQQDVVWSGGSTNVLSCLVLVLRHSSRICPRLLRARANVLPHTAYWGPCLDGALRFLGGPACPAAAQDLKVLLLKRLAPQPPTLKHLSRCRIRALLCLNWSLPEGLDGLHLPRHLLGYMKMEYD